MKMFRCARRVGDRVGDAVINRQQAGCVGIAKPCHLNWRGLARKHQQSAVFRMATEIHKDIDAVTADHIAYAYIILPVDVMPDAVNPFELLGYIVWSFNVCV